MTVKEQYKELCKDIENIPLFCQDWWMDAVCINEWDVLLAEENGKIVGALPFHLKKKLGFRYVLQPQLTQYNGIWIKREQIVTDHERLSYEKKIFNKLIEQLEQIGFSFYQQCFHMNITNWLPFYWHGYKETTRYTYLIENISDLDEIYSTFTHAKQKQIRKAEKNLSVDFSMSPLEFYNHHKKSLGRKEIIYSYELFLRIYKAATSRKQGQIISLCDKEGNIHACLFTIWDKMSAYNLICSRNSQYASSGASTLIVWEAIKYLNGKTQTFDFEGSMIEGVENSFRQFGTIQKPYFEISKHNSIFFEAIFTLRTKFRSKK